MGGSKLLAASAWRANDNGDGTLATKHVIDLGGMVDNFIHSRDDEIDGHDLHDGMQSQHCRPGGHAHKAIFADGRIHHAPGTKLLEETRRDLVRAFEVADLLAPQ